MLSILASLSRKNGFHVENHGNFLPSKKVLASELRSLSNNTVYVNHAGFLQSEGGLIWLNVVESPLTGGQVCFTTRSILNSEEVVRRWY